MCGSKKWPTQHVSVEPMDVSHTIMHLHTLDLLKALWKYLDITRN